jgi:hypothetical protein
VFLVGETGRERDRRERLSSRTIVCLTQAARPTVADAFARHRLEAEG